MQTAFTAHAGIQVPLICGAMYPCSNPELVAAVSAAGGIGIVQPISLSFVHRHDLREGLRLIRRITDEPIGFNALVEKSSDVYMDRMKRWVDVALEEGVRFFVTALGNPRWVVDRVHAVGGVVYHDVTERRWAELALDHGVDGLICVNRRAGGHAGRRAPEALLEELSDLGVPLVCAGGIGDERAFVEAIEMGYAGAQLGTRFIATTECAAHDDYKRAILAAGEDDIVLTEKISGIPVAVIETDYVRRVGTEAGWLAKRMLRHPRAKHWMRMIYQAVSVWQLRQASLRGTSYRDYFQAGKSVGGIHAIEPAGDIVRRFAAALDAADRARITA
ncbi:MAG: nitronate monooxygenase [Sandaracinaceae bacterium]|nr:nitronate monooxygenase [Sandaracinaceae bacterium]